MVSPIARLRAKLVLGCTGMCACVTLFCLLGGRAVRARADGERASQAELIHGAVEVEAQVHSGTEAGLLFLLTGNDEERRLSLSKLDAAETDAKSLAKGPLSAAPDEGAVLRRTVASLDRLNAAAVALFTDFDSSRAVDAARYRSFKDATDAANEPLAALHTLARSANARAAARSARLSDAFTAIVGLAAVLAAAAIAVAFARAIRDAEGRASEDLDDRQRRDGELRRDQKMEAVGRLAGGIANDFNNKLSIILGYSGIALDGMSPGDPMFTAFSEIKEAGERSADLTRQLLSLGRYQPQETRVLDVGAVVESMRRMFGRVLGEKIELVLIRDATPCTVEVPQGHVEQILTNLVLNARDAMPNGGNLRIEVRAVDVSESDARKRAGMHAGRHVLLRVTDAGIGMSEETMERIFEPFFTTKEDARREQGKGTGLGLGLSTVFGIVRQRSGHIRVESELGKGSTFEIHLPEAKPRPARLQESPSSGTTRAARTILVVEDEEQVRNVVEQILRRHRYGVLVAESATEALLICERHPGNIDLLVTDVIMHEMNGPDLAEQLLERRPDMKVLYMSGYTGDVDLLTGDDGDASSFLQKPVTPETLRRKVRGILRSPLPSGLPAGPPPDPPTA